MQIFMKWPTWVRRAGLRLVCDRVGSRPQLKPNTFRLVGLSLLATASVPLLYGLKPTISAWTSAWTASALAPSAGSQPGGPVSAPGKPPAAASSAQAARLTAQLTAELPPSTCTAQASAIDRGEKSRLDPAQAPQLSTTQALAGLAFADRLGAALTDQAAVQFPQIHGRARLARVPVIMYHDILPEKQVFFDVTPAEFEADLELIRQQGLTPISLDQLVQHLQTGVSLPPKPIVLSFDDGYQGHYKYVYPLLRRYGYPATFAIYPAKVGRQMGRSSLTWNQLRQMAADPLVTIASHSLSHPADLTQLSKPELREQVVESKRILETQLGISIRHFVYPEGHHDSRVEQWVQRAGYRSGLTMDDSSDQFAGASESLLSIERIGQGNLEAVLDQADGGPAPPDSADPAGQAAFQFGDSIQLQKQTTAGVPLIFATGGRPVTLHADRRYQVGEIVAKTNAVAAVDGAFFSLERLDSNVMVGPVLSQRTNRLTPAPFAPGNAKEIRRIRNRPLVLISPSQVKFTPFDPERHNQLAGLRAELPQLTDAFVAAAWLVRSGQPQSAESFGNLFDFDAHRDRAFWGIDQAGRPVVGVSGDYIDSVSLGQALSRAGLRDAVMLDSGASASLVFKGETQMSYLPRPVPHVVALVPTTGLDRVGSPVGSKTQQAGKAQPKAAPGCDPQG